jgi:hypothetical protein
MNDVYVLVMATVGFLDMFVVFIVYHYMFWPFIYTEIV